MAKLLNTSVDGTLIVSGDTVLAGVIADTIIGDGAGVTNLEWANINKKTSITAGSGLAGGGSLDSNISINVVSKDDGIVVNADDIKLNIINDLTSTSSTRPISAAQAKVLNDKKVDKAITITASNGLTGGGDLSGNRTISHLVTPGNKHIPSGGAANQFLKYSADGTAIWSTLPTGQDGSYVKKTGDTMTGVLTLKTPVSSAAITNTTANASLKFGTSSTGTTPGTYFFPMTEIAAQHGQGYVTHVTTGLVKNGYGSGWGDGVSGYFVGTGGSDANPTQYFTLAHGGKIRHSLGHEFYSTNFKPTKTDVGLGNVNDWGASSSISSTSNTSYATSGAVKTAHDKGVEALNKANTKLDATANAVSATKLLNPRQINGTNFDGTSNITTANWGTARSIQVGSTSKSVNGSGNVSWNFAEIGTAKVHTGLSSGTAGNITTAEFVQWLTDQGAFAQSMWVGRGSWSYANNKTITDTTVGNIHLSGSTIEVIANGSGNYTIKISTPTTTSGGGTASADYIYIYNGTTYSPGWRRLYSTSYKPTSADIGLGNVGNYSAVNKAGDTMTGNLKIAPSSGQSTLTLKTLAAQGAQGLIKFEDTDGQHIQIRANTFDAIRAPFGIHIERSGDNPQTSNKAYLEVEGEIYAAKTQRVYHQGFKPTKSDVGLDQVNNWTASSAVNSSSTATYATSAAVKTAYDKAMEAISAGGANQSITITGSGSLTGGGNLTANRVITHLTSDGHKHIPTGGAPEQILKYSASGTAIWGSIPTASTTVLGSVKIGSGLSIASGVVSAPIASASANGIMSSGDKSKLDGVASGANNYSHPATTRSNTTNTANPGSSGTFAVIDSILSSAEGHITGVNTRTITMPVAAPQYVLPKATSATLGGVTIGNNITVSDGKISIANYEPTFTKNNAFNKTFGTSAGSVAEGNHMHVLIRSEDKRAINDTPQLVATSPQANFQFRANSTDGLTDGGIYHGVMSFRPYGSSTDFSGGGVHQLGFSENGNLWLRTSNGASAWKTWNKLLHTGNFNVDTKADKSTTISVSGSLSGGGDLSANRSIAHLTTAGHIHLPAGGASNQWLKWSAAGTGAWVSQSSLVRGTYLTGSNYDGNASTTWSVDATSANTASKVVARDASGNFSAGMITSSLTGNVTGNASTATKWQTARSFTIGKTTKTVDGTGNLSWSFNEIGFDGNALVSKFTLPNSSGSICYSRVCSMNANVGTGRANFSAIIMGGTNYGGQKIPLIKISFSTRGYAGTGALTTNMVEAVQLGSGNGDTDISFITKLNGANVELWIKTTSYPYPPIMFVFDSTQCTVNADSNTTTAPTGTICNYPIIKAWDSSSLAFGTGATNMATGNHTHTPSQVGLSNVPNTIHSDTSAINTVAVRNGSGDLVARLLRSEYANQNTISGAIAFRVNNTTDNYNRYCSDPAAVRAWLGLNTASSEYVKKVGDTMTGPLVIASGGDLGINAQTSGGRKQIVALGGANLYLANPTIPATNIESAQTIVQALNATGAISSTSDICSNGGYIKSVKNGVTMTIASDNSSYTHYTTSATVGHYFNKRLSICGEIYAGPSYNQRVYHQGFKPTKEDVGLPNVKDVSLNWAWGTANPTHMWGSQGDATQSYVYNGTQVKAFAGLGNVNNWGASSDISANSTSQYATTNMVAQVRAEKQSINTTSGALAPAYYTVDNGNTTGSKIRLPVLTNSAKMLTFTIRIYQGYNHSDIQISGYLYSSTNNWYSPKATMISGTTSIRVVLGRDTDGYAYAWVTGSQYRGVAVLNVVGGHKSQNWNSGWTISESDSIPNIALDTTVYPPYSPNNKPTKADVGLGSVNNWGASSAIGANSTAEYATTNMVAQVRSGYLSYGIGTHCVSWNSTNVHVANWANSGFFNGSGLTNAPSSSWYYYLNMTHNNSAGYKGMIACDFHSHELYYGRVTAGAWGGWARIWNSSNFNPGNLNNNRFSTKVVGIDYSGNDAVYEIHKPGVVAYGVMLISSNTISFVQTNGGGGWVKTLTSTDTAGNFTATGNVTAYSDIKLKKDLEIIQNPIEKIKNITGYTYTRIDSGKRESGVVAQDVLKVLPEVVHSTKPHDEDNDKTETLSVAYGNMVGLLIEGIKEQQKQIEEQQQQINELKEMLKK